MACQDVSAIEAILQQIVDDPSVIQVVRARAQRLSPQRSNRIGYCKCQAYASAITTMPKTIR